MTMTKEENTLRYWKASLAWKNVGNWAKGWTQGDFIVELRHLSCDNDNLGRRADTLLDDMIKGIERQEIHAGTVVYLELSKPAIAEQQLKTKISGL